MRRDCYVRENMVPVFISERTPSKNREDLWELLQECNMSHLNRLEWLIRTNKKYSGDNLFVISYEDNKPTTIKVDSMYDLVKRSDNINKKLLEIICSGDSLYSSEIVIDDTSRLHYHKLLMAMYVKEYDKKKVLQQQGIERAKANKVYTGRKQTHIDSLLLESVANDFANKLISADEAARKLNISKTTFYRRLR